MNSFNVIISQTNNAYLSNFDFQRLLANQDDLVNIFREQVNQHLQGNNQTFFKAFEEKIITLASENQLSYNTIQRLRSLYFNENYESIIKKDLLGGLKVALAFKIEEGYKSFAGRFGLDIDFYKGFFEIKIKNPLVGYDELISCLEKFSDHQIKIHLNPLSIPSLNELSAFLHKFGEKIHELYLSDLKKDFNQSEPLTDEYIAKVISKCPNLRSLELISKDLSDECFKVINQLKSLQVLKLDLPHIKTLPEELPVTLNSLTLNGCEKLQKLPTNWPNSLKFLYISKATSIRTIDTLPPSIINLSITECSSLDFIKASLPDSLMSLLLTGNHLSEDDIFILLRDLIKKNPMEALSFACCISIESCFQINQSHRFAEFFFNEAEFSELKPYLDDLGKYFSPQQCLFYFKKIIEEDFDFFLKNYDYFTISIYNPLDLSVFLSYVIDWEKVQKFSLDVGFQQEFEDLSDIDLQSLLELFDQINFTNEDKPDFIDLSKVALETLNPTPNSLKRFLADLLNSIDKNTPVLALPKDENERKECYDYLKNVLKHLIKAANQLIQTKNPEDIRRVSIELIYLAEASSHCGDRWIKESIQILKVLQKSYDIKIEGLKEKISFWLGEYKESMMEEISLTILDDLIELGENLNDAYLPHIMNRLAKCLNKNGFPVSFLRSYNFNDVFSFEKKIPDQNFENHIKTYLHVMTILKFLFDKIKDACSLDGKNYDLIFQSLGNVALEDLKSQINEVERFHKKNQMIYGKLELQYLLEQAQIEYALLTEDKNWLETLLKSVDITSRKKKEGELRIRYNQAKQNYAVSNNMMEEEKTLKRNFESIDGIEDNPRPLKRQKIEDERQNKIKVLKETIVEYEQWLKEENLFSEQILKAGYLKTIDMIQRAKNEIILDYLEKCHYLKMNEETGVYDLTYKGLFYFLEKSDLLVN